MKSKVCGKFERRLNNEIAAGEYFHDHKLISILKQEKLTEENKKLFGIPPSEDISMYDITRSALDSLPKIRFIYLISLLEAFFKEYLSERMSVSIDSVENKVKQKYSAFWQKEFNTSTSLYNPNFVNYVINDLYKINLEEVTDPITFEMGELRRCIVHNDGRLNENYRAKLKNTIEFLNQKNKVENAVIITKELMGIYIEDFRKIIKLYDY